MIVVHHPDQASHDPGMIFWAGRFVEQVERPERYRVLLEAVMRDRHKILEAPLGSLAPILAIHDRHYVEFLRTIHDRWISNGYGPVAVPHVHPTHRMTRKPTDLVGELGWYSNSTTCPIVSGTWQAVVASAQAAVHGARMLKMSGGPVYAMCRPPGHHAYPDLMTGVCYLNNAAIAANELVEGFGKIAILDIDVHHGNGIQSIFWERSDVLYCSIHIDPCLAAPFFAGYKDEVGAGPGLGLTFNQPLPHATSDPKWLVAIDGMIARARDFKPGALVVALGLDASERDPMDTFRITEDGFREAGRKISAVGLPTLLVQEGGYLNPMLEGYLRAFLRGVESEEVFRG
ncbi:MAG: histone deacetylase family protein [Mesorhizobium sp.]|uniref:histone deacetylase family protein n=1 Tax=Mesorhizobium sp. TaxID=1871066 RepID=UPI0012024441|nr:histone deacetylase family protein [Mesorhizobium sp.]TIM99878.1 MAG: histone deacetylase family protein [Mesorhizobium sp.]